MSVYAVLVSNIGIVADNLNNPILARKEYGDWVKAAKAPQGRAAGESVTLLKDGEPELEYFVANETDYN